MQQITPYMAGMAILSASQLHPQHRARRHFLEVMKVGGRRIYDRREPIATPDQDWSRLYPSPHVLRWDASRSPPPEAG